MHTINIQGCPYHFKNNYISDYFIWRLNENQRNYFSDIAVETPGQPRAVHLFLLDKNEDSTNSGDLIFINQAVIVGSSYNLTSIDDRIVWFVLVDGKVEVEVGELRSKTFYPRSHRDNKDLNIRFKPYVGCFNVLNPDTLFLEVRKTLINRDHCLSFISHLPFLFVKFNQR